MRILIAGSVLQEGWTGGEPLVGRLLATGLREQGAEVIVVARKRSGLALIALGCSPFDWDVVTVGTYRHLLEETRPDIVLGFYDYDTSLCRATDQSRIPFISCAHIYWPVCPIGVLYVDGEGPCTGPRFTKCLRHMSSGVPDSRLPLSLPSIPPPLGLGVLTKFATRWRTLASADAIVVPSHRMARILQSEGYEKLRVVPNGVDPNEFPPHEWVPGQTKELLFPSGSPSERKGLGEFEKVANRVGRNRTDTRFVATNVGNGGLVEGTGHLTRAAFVNRLSRAYAVITPALWDEPFGMVLIEAMAAACPVVTYAAGAAEEIVVDGESGLVVPRGDTNALAEAIERLIDDESLAHRLGTAGRRRVEEMFTTRKMTDGYLSVINSVLETRASVDPGGLHSKPSRVPERDRVPDHGKLGS